MKSLVSFHCINCLIELFSLVIRTTVVRTNINGRIQSQSGKDQVITSISFFYLSLHLAYFYIYYWDILQSLRDKCTFSAVSAFLVHSLKITTRLLCSYRSNIVILLIIFLTQFLRLLSYLDMFLMFSKINSFFLWHLQTKS